MSNQKHPVHLWKALLRRAVRVFFALIAILLAAFLLYAAKYYHADDRAKAAMQGTKNVTVTKTWEWYFFDGPGTETAAIFCPGAKVEARAYAPLMLRLAEEGMDAFLVRMPLRFAFLGMDNAEQIMARYDYAHWIIGGHSLGGAMAASFASAHLDALDGLFLLAAYPTAPLDRDGFALLSVYGSEDGVLNPVSFERGRAFFPADSTVMRLEGGNHALFGDYGRQAGDGEAAFSAREQQAITALLIADKWLPKENDAKAP